MALGQTINVFTCSLTPPTGTFTQLDPSTFTFCPSGQAPYLVVAYLPYDTSQSSIDLADAPFDPAVAGGFFSFGVGLVVMAFLLGLKGSVLLRPFWSKHF